MTCSCENCARLEANYPQVIVRRTCDRNRAGHDGSVLHRFAGAQPAGSSWRGYFPGGAPGYAAYQDDANQGSGGCADERCKCPLVAHDEKPIVIEGIMPDGFDAWGSGDVPLGHTRPRSESGCCNAERLDCKKKPCKIRSGPKSIFLMANDHRDPRKKSALTGEWTLEILENKWNYCRSDEWPSAVSITGEQKHQGVRSFASERVRPGTFLVWDYSISADIRCCEAFRRVHLFREYKEGKMIRKLWFQRWWQCLECRASINKRLRIPDSRQQAVSYRAVGHVAVAIESGLGSSSQGVQVAAVHVRELGELGGVVSGLTADGMMEPRWIRHAETRSEGSRASE